MPQEKAGRSDRPKNSGPLTPLVPKSGWRLKRLDRSGLSEKIFWHLTRIRHIGPKTSVKLRSEASCPESKAAMTTMVVDQFETSSPVKSPLKMWRLSD